MQTQSAGNIAEKDLIEKGPWIYQQKGNGPLQKVKPFTLAVRAEIDKELLPRSIEFMKRQAAAGKPFFLYLPFSMGHAPNLPSKQFAGKSPSAQYGDKMMEGDYHVGQVLDTLKELKPRRQHHRRLRVRQRAHGPVFHDRDFGTWGRPTWATRARSAASWARRPKARSAPSLHPLAREGQAQYQLVRDVLGDGLHADFRGHHRSQAAHGSCDRWRGPDGRALRQERRGQPGVAAHLHGPDIVAVRWKQWRIYLKDMNLTGTDQQKLGGLSINAASLYYPKIYNIQVDPHEDLQLPNYLWAMGPPLKAIAEYEASVKKYPNPPSGNLTDFRGRTGM